MTDLRKAAKGKPCVICGQNDGTTVLHHIRAGHGGIGCKPPDYCGIEVCSECHGYLHGEGVGDYKTMLIAHLRQVGRWIASGQFSELHKGATMDDDTVVGAAIMLMMFAAGAVGFALGWWLG